MGLDKRLTGKFALGDDVLPNGGPVVKAGDVIGFSDWIIARDTSVWGEDAAEMKPERWIDDDGKSLRRFDQWQYHVFNGEDAVFSLLYIISRSTQEVRVSAWA